MTGLQTLATGLTFGESPCWHEGRLWLSNWVAQEIVAVDPAGGSEVMLRMPFPELPFSIDWLPDGRLLIASASDRPLLVQEPDGTLVPYAASDRGWNELVVDGRGNAYVNGVGFDAMAGGRFAAGVVALVTPDGAVRQVADGIAFPTAWSSTRPTTRSSWPTRSAISSRRSTSRPTATSRTGGSGRTRRGSARRDLHGCRGRDLVRGRAEPAVHPGPPVGTFRHRSRSATRLRCGSVSSSWLSGTRWGSPAA